MLSHHQILCRVDYATWSNYISTSELFDPWWGSNRLCGVAAQVRSFIHQAFLHTPRAVAPHVRFIIKTRSGRHRANSGSTQRLQLPLHHSHSCRPHRSRSLHLRRNLTVDDGRLLRNVRRIRRRQCCIRNSQEHCVSNTVLYSQYYTPSNRYVVRTWPSATGIYIYVCDACLRHMAATIQLVHGLHAPDFRWDGICMASAGTCTTAVELDKARVGVIRA